MDTEFLTDLYIKLGLTIFEKHQHGQFCMQSDIPEWLAPHLPNQNNDNTYDLASHFPFLECFLPEAEQHWLNKNQNFLDSGIWLTPTENDAPLPLEAKACWLNNKPVLLIENASNRYYDQILYLQKARDNLLLNEKLEDEVFKRTMEIKKREEDIAIKLVSLTSYRDEETGAHIRRIGLYAAIIAAALGWEQNRVDDIRIAAPMHDIGKIGIPDRILLKAGKLTDTEFEIMKRHTSIGAEMLRGTDISVMDMAADIALNHHERWDGTGYPSGLAGTNIPEAARITTIVDIYDALVHKRVYKDAFPEKDALQLLSDSAGYHIDPYIYKVFLANLPQIRQIREENQDTEPAFTT